MKHSVQTTEPLATDLAFEGDELVVTLTDGRRVCVPLAFYPTLLGVTDEQRRAWTMIGPGEGFEWPDLDLHLSTAGIVAGTPEQVIPERLRQKWKEEADRLAADRAKR